MAKAINIESLGQMQHEFTVAKGTYIKVKAGFKSLIGPSEVFYPISEKIVSCSDCSQEEIVVCFEFTTDLHF